MYLPSFFSICYLFISTSVPACDASFSCEFVSRQLVFSIHYVDNSNNNDTAQQVKIIQHDEAGGVTSEDGAEVVLRAGRGPHPRRGGPQLDDSSLLPRQAARPAGDTVQHQIRGQECQGTLSVNMT